MKHLLVKFIVHISLLLVILFPVLLTTYSVIPTLVHADELEDIQKELAKLNKELELSRSATKPLEGQLETLRVQLAQVQAQIQTLSNKINQKEAELAKRTQRLAEQQALLEARIRSYYIRSYQSSPLTVIFSATSASDLMRELSYRQAATNEDQKIIASVTADVIDLLTQKEKLEKDKRSLASVQAEVNKNATFLGGEIKKAKDYQTNLTGKIAELSAKQQAILAAKSGNFVTSVGDVPLADDANSRPTFDPGFRPAFALFSFGAYTHRNGMSQYGAKGRAESGQSAEQILAAYYPGSTLNKSYATPATINVDGKGSRNFEEEYLIGIYEMPSSFPKEALKAQAVAARTYAIRRGGSICATESCQVFKDAPGRTGAWVDAVRETRGWVLEGGPNAQYSSTTGGYGNNSGWDTKCGGRGCWTPEAYEKIAGSPWFYKGWYKDRNGDSCGRSHPWLNNEEMSDILNAYLVYQSGSDRDRISPVNTSCWPGNPFSISEMRDKASGNGGAVTNVTSASVVYADSGSTANVTFNTNRGAITINGADFKTIFNLRAPGYVSIKSPLYNIESK
jgi:peptidoglycan hydrolase-like amidase